MIKLQNIIAKIDTNIKKKKWECLVDNCVEYAIDSHLIQRNGLLNNIAENGHLVEVTMVDAYKWNKNNSPFKFSLVGIKKALTHKVFCNKHDSEIFKSIESKDKDLKSYNAFLLFSYRAVCAEIRKKMINIEQYTRILNSRTLDGKIDKNEFVKMRNGFELGINDLKVLKRLLEEEIQQNKKVYTYMSFTFDKIEVYASSAFTATNIEIPISKNNSHLENLYLHILPLKTESLILVGYHNDYVNNNMIKYCESWKNLDRDSLERKLTELFCLNIENWGISASLYRSLKDVNKKKFFNEVSNNLNYFGLTKKIDFNLFEDN